jgi:hypothetical protein
MNKSLELAGLELPAKRGGRREAAAQPLLHYRVSKQQQQMSRKLLKSGKSAAQLPKSQLARRR